MINREKKNRFFAHNLNIGGIESSLVSLLINIEKKYKIDLILEDYSGDLLAEIPKSINIKIYKTNNSKNIILRKINNFNHTITLLIITSLVAAITIGGKAYGKDIAINNKDSIIIKVSTIIAKIKG